MSKAKTPAIDRPFAPQIVAEAKRIAAQYHLVLWQEDGEWYGRGLELPNVFGDGPTPAKCVAESLAALTTAVAYLLESGGQPPPPAREGARTEQVNVRLSAEEKLGFESAAKARGFKGLSDFMRFAAFREIE
jgi:predicted RNase H-like HicB family nuclease